LKIKAQSKEARGGFVVPLLESVFRGADKTRKCMD